MLKIRISGKKQELEQILPLLEGEEISRFQHTNGQVTYAIDLKCETLEFIKKFKEKDESELNYEEKLNSIQFELGDLLNEMKKDD